MSVKESRAFCPGHVTGLFTIPPQENETAEKKGSLGAGFCLKKGTTTRILSCREKEDIIYINESTAENPVVSRTVLDLFRQETGNQERLYIEHHIELPLGSGFGTSGSGALSLAFALNDFFGKPLSPPEAGVLAHNAEILCSSGLGTVMGEYGGGAEIRIKPGAPGTGEVESIPLSDQTEALFIHLGPFPTPTLLKQKETRDRINRSGAGLLEELRREPSLDHLMQLSRQFAEGTGLISPRVAAVLHDFDQAKLNASMLMFGEAVYMIGSPNEIHRGRMISRRWSRYQCFTCGIDRKGVRIV